MGKKTQFEMVQMAYRSSTGQKRASDGFTRPEHRNPFYLLFSSLPR